jgi:hypothetical protein
MMFWYGKGHDVDSARNVCFKTTRRRARGGVAAPKILSGILRDRVALEKKKVVLEEQGGA